MVLNRELRLPVTGPFEIARVPASRIAEENGILSSEGRPLGNVAVLGACVRQLVPGGLEFLEQAVAARTGATGRGEQSLRPERATRAAPNSTPSQATCPSTPTPVPAPRRVRPPVFAVSTTDSRGNRTGTWSLDRPLISPDCTACGVCALFCPEGAITRDDGSIVVDYLYCKGCGICEVVCPVRNAIAMEAVGA